MRLSTRMHGMVDLTVGLTLAAYGALGGDLPGAAGWVPILVGGALLANALATDFELGLFRRIQMPLHLWIDAVLALALALSPWVLGFDRAAWIPHLLAGFVVALAAFLTDTIPGYERRRTAPTE